MTALDFADLERLTSFKLGVFDAPCPECGPRCREPANRKRKVLRIWRKEPGYATFTCARCGLSGWAGDRRRSAPVKPGAAPPPAENSDQHAARQAGKALFLWRHRQPAQDSPVEVYLRKARGYGGEIPATIGYLPPSKPEHHPAMIAAFGCCTEPEPGVINLAANMVRGVHLTLLHPDGLGKAGTGRDKLMVGPSSGWPIVVAPPNDLLGLAVTEGIETGLSIAEATGLGAWAAGAAGRMSALADKMPDYLDHITVAAEADEAGRKGAIGLAERLRQRGLHAELRFLDARRAAA